MQRQDRPSFGLIDKFLSILSTCLNTKSITILDTSREQSDQFCMTEDTRSNDQGFTNRRNVGRVYCSSCSKSMTCKFLVRHQPEMTNNNDDKSFYIKYTSLLEMMQDCRIFPFLLFLLCPFTTSSFSVFESIWVALWIGTSGNPWQTILLASDLWLPFFLDFYFLLFCCIPWLLLPFLFPS